MMPTIVLELTAKKLALELEIEKMLMKGRRRNFVLLASRQSLKLIKLSLFIKKLSKILTNKIRRQQSQKWIKLQKIPAASLLCFKAEETKMHLLPFSTWRASFPLLIKNLKSSQFDRLSKSKF